MFTARPRTISTLVRVILAFACPSLFGVLAFGAGLFNDGLDAHSIALGGADAAQTGSALAAMNSNPAALAGTSQTQLEFTLGGTLIRGKFERAGSDTARSRKLAGLFPAAAISFPAPRDLPIKIGVAVLPDVLSAIDWRYQDAPGGLGGTTSYGKQTHRSQITAVRSSIGLAAEVTRWLSLGASLGLIYDQNQLEAPYTFQSQPVLRGFKTLLDLETSGVGPSFSLGAQFHPSAKLTLGASYRSATHVDSKGRATGDARAQLQALGGGFALIDPTFRYDALVRTKLPQVLSGAVEWQAWPQLRLVAGIDWIDWSDAFDNLEIRLSHGSNPDLNAFVGSPAMTDIAPLYWQDQYVLRTGAEYTVTGNFTLRSGYSYARSAVPSETLTPLTAAIFEHKLSLGAGYRTERYHTDLAFLWALPIRQSVNRSVLLGGEFDRTSIRVSQLTLQWTSGVDF